MSGRVRTTLADGRRVTGFRKTLTQRATRTPSDQMPDWVLRYLVPTELSFSVAEGPTSIAGVIVTKPGPYVEARGKNQEWVLQQGAAYLAAIAGGLELRVYGAKLTRDAYPGLTTEAPWRPNVKRTLCLIYVPQAAVVIPRALDPALIFPVTRPKG